MTTAVALSVLGPALVLILSARGDVNELLGRVPAEANTVVAVDAAFAAPGDADAASPAASRPRSPLPLPKVAGLRHSSLLAPGSYRHDGAGVGSSADGGEPEPYVQRNASGRAVSMSIRASGRRRSDPTTCSAWRSRCLLGAVSQQTVNWPRAGQGANSARAQSPGSFKEYLWAAVAGVTKETPVVLAIACQSPPLASRGPTSVRIDRRLDESSAGNEKAAAVLASPWRDRPNR